MDYFNVSFNPRLQSLAVKNGSAAQQGIDIYQCPLLATICCDAFEQTEMAANAASYGYSCEVVTNCF